MLHVVLALVVAVGPIYTSRHRNAGPVRGPSTTVRRAVASDCVPACESGYTCTGGSCVDVNECLTSNGGCDALVTCTNTEGGRTCGDCPSGYTGTGETSCVDVDECLATPCQNGGACTNSPGSYSCECLHDWTGTNCADESGTAASIAWKATWTASPSATYSATTSGSPTATSPTFECWAKDYNGTDLPCSGSGGWTLTKAGTSVVQVASPFYSSSWSTNDQAIQLHTSAASLVKASPGAWTSGFTIWGIARQDRSTNHTIMAKSNGASWDFIVYVTASAVYLNVYNAAGSSGTAGSVSITIPAGAWFAWGCRYQPVADGTSVGRCLVNSTWGTEVTNAKLLRNTTGSEFGVYKNIYTSEYPVSVAMNGGVDGTVYSDAQLVNITRSLRGLIPTTGNSAVTFTRSSVASCQPTSTSGIFYLGPDFPCITERGLRIYGAYVLKGRYSEAFDSWTGTGTGSDPPAVTANNAAAPDGNTTAELVAFKSVDHATDVSDLTSPTAVTLDATSWTHAVYAKSQSGTVNVRIGWRSADSTTCSYTDCSVGTAAWTRCVHTATGTAASLYPFIGNNRACGGTDPGEVSVWIWGETFSNNDEAVPYSVVTTADSSIPASDFSYTSQQTLGEVCYAAKVGPDMTSTHAAGALGLFAHDTYGVGADDRGARVTGTSATGIIQDHTGGNTRTGTATVGGLNNASAQTIKVCYDLDNHIKIVDGTTLKTTTMSGSGNGTASAVPATVYLGQDGTNYLGWYLQGFAECNNYGSAGCTP